MLRNVIENNYVDKNIFIISKKLSNKITSFQIFCIELILK